MAVPVPDPDGGVGAAVQPAAPAVSRPALAVGQPPGVGLPVPPQAARVPRAHPRTREVLGQLAGRDVSASVLHPGRARPGWAVPVPLPIGRGRGDLRGACGPGPIAASSSAPAPEAARLSRSTSRRSRNWRRRACRARGSSRSTRGTNCSRTSWPRPCRRSAASGRLAAAGWSSAPISARRRTSATSEPDPPGRVAQAGIGLDLPVPDLPGDWTTAWSCGGALTWRRPADVGGPGELGAPGLPAVR